MGEIYKAYLVQSERDTETQSELSDISCKSEYNCTKEITVDNIIQET